MPSKVILSINVGKLDIIIKFDGTVELANNEFEFPIKKFQGLLLGVIYAPQVYMLNGITVIYRNVYRRREVGANPNFCTIYTKLYIRNQMLIFIICFVIVFKKKRFI